MTKLTLIRGLPGSGKSTLGFELVKNNWKLNNEKSVLLECDMYLTIKGEYIFDPKARIEGHTWVQNSAKVFLDNGYHVVVTGTLTRKWEIMPYKRMADEVGCEFEVYTCTGNYGSIHNVPEETIQAMRDRWEIWE
jgi:predicted kinase